VLKDRISEDEAIKGSIRMQDYYTDSCAINYLPDPLCKGFRLEFYLDGKRSIKAPDYTSYEQHEYYFSGTYPRINAWKLILRDIDYDEPLVSYKKEQLTIRIEKGRELFLKVRTILDTMYEKQLETYGNYNEYTQFGGNDLLTPPLEISLVHAMQRPLVIPRLDNTLTCHKQQDKTQIELINAIQAEQLGLHPDAAGIAGYLPSFMPTGSVELYAKWEEFVDDPRHLASGDWTPYQPVNEVDLTRFSFKNGASPATFEAAMNIGSHLEEMKKTLVKTGSELNEAQNYTVNMWANYDSRDTRFLEKWIWVLNKSVFHSYYPAAWNAPAEIITETTDRFSRISAQPFLIRYLNSKKPAVPVLAAKNITLVSVTDDWEDGKSFKRKASLNRLRFYFDRGRLTSGKGERLGFVLNEPSSAYNDYLVANNLVSVAGSDIISDSAKLYDGLYRHKGVLLNKSHFNVRDPYDLRNDDDDKGKDLEAYQPDYIPELGLITFLPKFDAALNLWVLDVELDLNDKNGGELHSPFVQMAIVNYQEYSHNYNDPGEAPDIAKDYRISAINKSSYVYIMGSRTIAVTPLSNKIRVSVELDLSSIKGLPQNDLSKFYGIVQHKKSGTVQWVAADGKVAGDAAAFSKLSFSTGLTAEIGYVNYSHTDYRFLLLETEDWGNSNDDKLDNVIHNKNSRIVLISLFDL
jgi:hypothetical protein